MTYMFAQFAGNPALCPGWPHRGPQGPNEDLAQCPLCLMPAYTMRQGETFGWHSDDCSLPIDHEGFCLPGGEGHVMPEGWKVRG